MPKASANRRLSLSISKRSASSPERSSPDRLIAAEQLGEQPRELVAHRSNPPSRSLQLLANEAVALPKATRAIADRAHHVQRIERTRVDRQRLATEALGVAQLVAPVRGKRRADQRAHAFARDGARERAAAVLVAPAALAGARRIPAECGHWRGSPGASTPW
jgi:hypothetical protein